MKPSASFYSSGKLMLSGEYLVLKGALALAFPLKYGQRMDVFPLESKNGWLEWESYFKEELFLKASFSFPQLQLVHASDRLKGEKLLAILKQTKDLNPDFLSSSQQAWKVSFYANFNPHWGIGSSSTFINNLAHWAQVDPYLLNAQTFGGSGYDIACASAQKTVLYRLKEDRPVFSEVNFRPSFLPHLYLLYLNVKQNTADSLRQFQKAISGLPHETIESVSILSRDFLRCATLEEFGHCMEQHEYILSRCLLVQPVKERLFPDFEGYMKSMGSWGGDFVLVAWLGSQEVLQNYFFAKGYTTLIPLKEIAVL